MLGQDNVTHVDFGKRRVRPPQERVENVSKTFSNEELEDAVREASILWSTASDAVRETAEDDAHGYVHLDVPAHELRQDLAASLAINDVQAALGRLRALQLLDEAA